MVSKSSTISISLSREDHLKAAKALSDRLTQLDCNHTFIGTLGLPVVAGPTYGFPDFSITILHPCILIFTKLKRWSMSYTSTRPKTARKTQSDRDDINFLIKWLAEHDIAIQFELYRGKTKPELLRMVRRFHGRYEGNTELMEMLRSTMPGDWEEMVSLPLEVEDMAPPVVW
ncbi:hypothetical protein EWM64_g5814 [Hericium alpestre]|uniref:Uncharacterized protein n=1 Tax=Hericium alpestre TaxID=135208 RepID=A0A4Y9ZVW1_9AGAM|nr:hypothetical protein EWM64_g5814 [Hericium alpestre]